MTTDAKLERALALLLRTGVLLAGGVVLTGGIFYVAAHGGEPADYRKFIPAAVDGRARHIIRFGVLLLIATPVLRVAFSLVGFALERDRKYVAIAAIVLALLAWSLLAG